ncbi:MAG: hypothetical protein GX573_21425 [Chloroflexi bacterium]|nr:hypothetical protein [Chloroflexota bacterium]
MTYEPDTFPPEPPPDYEYDYEPPPEALRDMPPPPDALRFMDEAPPESYDYEPEPFVVSPDQPPLPGFEPPPAPPAPDNWSWLDARFVGLEQVDANGDLTGYEVGCVDLYADTVSGDLGGTFLRVQAFAPDELDQAEDLFNRLNNYAYDQGMGAHDIPDLAERAAAKIAGREGLEAPQWRALTPDEYTLFEREFGLARDPDPDVPPEYAHDDLLRAAYELGGVEVEVEEEPEHYPAAQALEEIGLSADGFDPDRDPPPFYDQATNTAYWIGVYQPDPDDRDICVASILSLTRDPDSGAYEAQLAPCMVGDWNKAYEASEHLIGVADRSDDIERVFEAAEGMAIAGNQRGEWQHERGVELEPDSARDIGEYAAQQWELDL